MHVVAHVTVAQALVREETNDGDSNAVAQVSDRYGNTDKRQAPRVTLEPQICGRQGHRHDRHELIDAAALWQDVQYQSR